jgi:hypothetical protein
MVILAPVVVLLYASALLDDTTFTWLIEEERPIELLGAGALAVSALFCVLAWRRAAPRPRFARFSLLILAALLAFGAGEEVSWGQRIIGIETPELLKQTNYQQELNLHNMNAFTGLLDADKLFLVFWVVLGVLVPIAAIVPHLRSLFRRFLPVLPVAVAFGLVVNQVLATSMTAVFRAQPGLYHSTTFGVEHSVFEIKETAISLFLAAGMWLVYDELRRPGRSASSVAPHATADAE